MKKYLPTIDIFPKPISVIVAVPKGEEAEYIEKLEKSSIVKEVLYSKFRETNITSGLSYSEVEHSGIKLKLLSIEEDFVAFNINFEDFSNSDYVIDNPSIFQRLSRWLKNLFDKRSINEIE